MTSLQRVLAAVHFQHADRPAVIPQIFAHAARLCGEDVVSYSRDGKLAARCQLAALERYGHDAVFAVLGTCADPAAFGCSARSMREGYPAIQPAPEKTRQILRDGRMPDPARCEGTREVLEAVRILRRELGDDRAVVSAVLGPMTLLSQLLGLEEAMFLAVDEPAEFVELLAAATRFASDFARCQADAGAHAIAVFDPAASPAVLPPSMIRQYLLPGLVEVIDAIHRAGPLAWQHTAGPTAPVLEDFAALGADILNFDYCVTPEEAIEKVRRVCVDGNLKPLDFVDEKPERVAELAAALVRRFEIRGGFILSSGCEIPPEARPETIEAFVAAARSQEAHSCRY